MDFKPSTPVPDTDTLSQASGESGATSFDDSAYLSEEVPLHKSLSCTSSDDGQTSLSELGTDQEVCAIPIMQVCLDNDISSM